MPKERNKADGYREKAPIKREKSDVFIDSSEREVSRPKVKAKKGSWRISEATLLILAAIGGSIGALLGMKIWRRCIREESAMLITSWRVPVQVWPSADSVGTDSNYLFHLMIRDFIAIDFETANQQPSSVCSIGVVLVRNGQVADSFYSLIQPEPNYYNYWCQRVHGLSQCDTDDAPVFSKVWQQLEEKIADVFFSDLDACGYDLQNHHHALADAEACAAIALYIL